MPVYDAWQEIYVEHGVELAFEKWATCIGTADMFDPCVDLQAALAAARSTRAALTARHRTRTDALIAAEAVRPGVREYVAEATPPGADAGRGVLVEPALGRRTPRPGSACARRSPSSAAPTTCRA